MKIIRSVEELKESLSTLGAKSLGFVPTMGALHDGHLSLVKRSQEDCEKTIVSIFVNRLQFNNAQDFEKYPRNESSDFELLKKNGVDYCFVPTESEMYRVGESFRVVEIELSKELEGQYRPGHFDGMLTVVHKLLNLLRPDVIYLGEKDYQQLLLVKKMVADLFMNLRVVGCPTLRDKNGLALSSRNFRLNESQRNYLQAFSRILKSYPLAIVKAKLKEASFEVEYVEDRWSRRLAAIVYCGVRFIDNIPLDEIKIGVNNDTHT